MRLIVLAILLAGCLGTTGPGSEQGTPQDGTPAERPAADTAGEMRWTKEIEANITLDAHAWFCDETTNNCMGSIGGDRVASASWDVEPFSNLASSIDVTWDARPGERLKASWWMCVVDTCNVRYDPPSIHEGSGHIHISTAWRDVPGNIEAVMLEVEPVLVTANPKTSVSRTVDVHVAGTLDLLRG